MKYDSFVSPAPRVIGMINQYTVNLCCSSIYQTVVVSGENSRAGEKRMCKVNDDAACFTAVILIQFDMFGAPVNIRYQQYS